MQYKTYRTLVFKEMRSLMLFTSAQPVFETFKILSEINRLADVIKRIDAMQPFELNNRIERTTEVFESMINKPLTVEYDAI